MNDIDYSCQVNTTVFYLKFQNMKHSLLGFKFVIADLLLSFFFVRKYNVNKNNYKINNKRSFVNSLNFQVNPII